MATDEELSGSLYALVSASLISCAFMPETSTCPICTPLNARPAVRTASTIPAKARITATTNAPAMIRLRMMVRREYFIGLEAL